MLSPFPRVCTLWSGPPSYLIPRLRFLVPCSPGFQLGLSQAQGTNKCLVKCPQVKHSGAKSILWNPRAGVLVGAPMRTGAELLTSQPPLSICCGTFANCAINQNLEGPLWDSSLSYDKLRPQKAGAHGCTGRGCR